MKTTKALLLTTAVFEMAAAIALLIVPTLVTSALLNQSLDTAAAVVVARIGGAALAALGVICWFARDLRGTAVNGLLTGLLVYNVAVACLLMQSALSGTSGLFLWPAVALHLLLATWCLMRLRGAA
jgi:hypothetical protein